MTLKEAREIFMGGKKLLESKTIYGRPRQPTMVSY
jgi:hypothetical protein